MNQNISIRGICLGLLVTIVCACSNKDKVISVGESDPEMNAAIAKARNTLPGFWKILSNPVNGEKEFALKVRITDPNGTEHFWVTEIGQKNGRTKGTIANDPNTVKSVKLGDRIEIPEGDISDWLYFRGGKMYGNETVKPLFSKLPPEEVKALKKIMANP